MACLLLALIFVPVVEVLRGSVRGSAQSVHLVRAFQAARSAIDAAEAMSYAELTDDALSRVPDTLELGEGVEKPRYEPVRQITAGAGTPGAPLVDVKVVTVRVGWQKTEGKAERAEVVLHGCVVRAK